MHYPVTYDLSLACLVLIMGHLALDRYFSGGYD
jgi:hypothetical protein